MIFIHLIKGGLISNKCIYRGYRLFKLELGVQTKVVTIVRNNVTKPVKNVTQSIECLVK